MQNRENHVTASMAAAQRLADQLSKLGGGTILAQLQTLATVDSPWQDLTLSPKGEIRNENGRIGIWSRQRNDVEEALLRSSDSRHEWSSWADVDSIPAKGGKKRIVLIGESVARGFFYDPALTPAGILERFWKTSASEIEVVDLARSALTYRGLMDLLSRVECLRPDALVVFAGNNWCSYEMLTKAHHLILCKKFDQGLNAVRDWFLEEHLVGLAEGMMNSVAEKTKALGIPGIIIIPEFNLVDWHENLPPPVLTVPDLSSWYSLHRAAVQAISEAQFGAARSHLRRMLKMDRGLSPITHKLLAKVYHLENATEEALICERQARDSVCGICVSLPGRCPDVVQKVMRRLGPGLGLSIVDVPELIAAAGGKPDKEYFLDYCHMRVGGLRLVLERVASVLQETFIEPARANAVELCITPQQEAMALFAAAIHSSQLDQPVETVRSLCAEACAVDSGVAAAMQDFVRMRTGAPRDWLSVVQPRFLSYASNVRFLGMASDNGRIPKGLLNAVDELARPHGVKSMMEEIAAIADDTSPSEINMLDPFYLLSVDRALRVGEDACAYYIARSRTTEFRVILSKQTAFKLEVCCRSLHEAGAQRLRIRWNGNLVTALRINSRWKHFKLSVPLGRTRQGANHMTLEWPEAEPNVRRLRCLAQERLEQKRTVEIYSRYGEIFSLILRAKSANKTVKSQ